MDEMIFCQVQGSHGNYALLKSQSFEDRQNGYGLLSHFIAYFCQQLAVT